MLMSYKTIQSTLSKKQQKAAKSSKKQQKAAKSSKKQQ
jgi:hypothetical protein